MKSGKAWLHFALGDALQQSLPLRSPFVTLPQKSCCQGLQRFVQGLQAQRGQGALKTLLQHDCLLHQHQILLTLQFKRALTILPPACLKEGIQFKIQHLGIAEW